METTQTHPAKEHPRQRRAKTAEKTPLPKTSRPLNDLLEWYSHLTLKNIKNIPRHYARDAFFKDPFTELYTTDELQKYYQRTLQKIHDVHFSFENVVEDGLQSFVTWVMTARFMGREFSVQGTSHFKFNSSGLCEYHRDYYDLSEEIYEHLPLLGAVFRGLKRVLN